VKTAEPLPVRKERPHCAKCAHYFITYDPRFPYGCRAMNFKSRVLPQTEVEAVSGMDCQLFQPRPTAARKAAKANDGRL
jgi:hypothetical protein